MRTPNVAVSLLALLGICGFAGHGVAGEPSRPSAAAIAAAEGATAPTDADVAAEAAIRQRIVAWAEAFADARPGELCDLFSEDLVARVRGEPARGREDMCTQFARTASDRSTDIAYVPRIESVIASGDLAVADLTWALRVRRGVVDTRFVERAQYVFAREADGAWRVLRLMSYIEPVTR